MRILVAATFALALAGCGAKTGLLIPDADLPYDAGMDGGYDAGIDAPICMPQPVALQRRGAQIMFVLDRSNSMDDTLQGENREPGDPRPSRWDVLGTTLEAVLMGADPLLEMGAKIYPAVLDMVNTPAEACMVEPGIDITPARGRIPRLVRLFQTTAPGGGTPTADALNEVETFFMNRPAPGVPRFVVLATDGGPNCHPDPSIPTSECLCTGGPGACTADPDFGPYNCIDETRTLDVIRRLSASGIPVYVIGIDDPMRRDLADVLDRMAIAGERPRDVPGERRFYSVGDRTDLEEALTTITDTIARCVFELDPTPTLDATLEVSVDGTILAQDGTRTEGWDFTAPDRTEITLFGGACERVTTSGGRVTAEILCDE
ncbi:MAG: VWA domain-containing protein [Sandaracinaceae bacterium]|nr:VWA domain-containing protein [Sandaracinaceae bacterium]